MESNKVKNFIITLMLVLILGLGIELKTYKAIESKLKADVNTLHDDNNRLKDYSKLIEKRNQDILKDLNKYEKELDKLNREKLNLENELEKHKKLNSRNKPLGKSSNNPKTTNFKATAYDLSYESCGKRPTDKGYGLTSTGLNLRGLSRTQAMVVAVDPKIIPLGSKVKLTFKEPYSHYNGVYRAEDTGGAIKGNIVDVYVGTNEYKEMKNFGRQDILLEIIE